MFAATRVLVALDLCGVVRTFNVTPPHHSSAKQGQLLWKEFNYFSGYSIPNFDKMVGNPVAR